MKEQLRWGRRKYLSFILLDMGCLIAANLIAVFLYRAIGDWEYAFSDYLIAMVTMLIIDVFVTLIFNTLNNVLRRGTKVEAVESLKHVVLSFLVFTIILFSLKQSSEYSRLTIYLAYGIYFMLIVPARIIWGKIIRKIKGRHKKNTALLVTTTGYIAEGVNTLHDTIEVKGIFVTDKTNAGEVENIPLIVESSEASAFICWMLVDEVYICGPDSIDVPETVLTACEQMDVLVHKAPDRKRFRYEVIKIQTVLKKNDPSAGLSFFEGERDIPFRISRLYMIFESEQDGQNGFHPHSQGWHMFFCPYGAIDIYIDTGNEQKHVLLDNPSVGLILYPDIWREMTWKRPGSVLCVAASGQYRNETLQTDHDEYLLFLKKRDWFAVAESAVIMGEKMA